MKNYHVIMIIAAIDKKLYDYRNKHKNTEEMDKFLKTKQNHMSKLNQEKIENLKSSTIKSNQYFKVIHK